MRTTISPMKKWVSKDEMKTKTYRYECKCAFSYHFSDETAFRNMSTDTVLCRCVLTNVLIKYLIFWTPFRIVCTRTLFPHYEQPCDGEKQRQHFTINFEFSFSLLVTENQRNTINSVIPVLAEAHFVTECFVAQLACEWSLSVVRPSRMYF